MSDWLIADTSVTTGSTTLRWYNASPVPYAMVPHLLTFLGHCNDCAKA